MRTDARKKLRNRKYATRTHRLTRLGLAPLVNAGVVRCARGDGCKYAEFVDGVWLGGYIVPGTPWDLGHDDLQPMYYSGPEHAGCNRSAPHRNKTSREW